MRAFLPRWAGADLLPLVVCLVVLLGLSGVPLLAGEPPVPIEGKLLVSGYASSGLYSYYMEGSSDNRTPMPVAGFVRTDISPLGDRVVYDVRTGAGPWHTNTSDIWTCNMDGSNQVDLTGPAGLGGINCRPDWSPDGSQIAFQHCAFDPLAGTEPCEQGFSVWVMNADGTEPHQASPPYPENPDYFSCEINCWAPNGYRLLANQWDPSGEVEQFVFTVDSDGTDVEVVPGISSSCDWSADGQKIAATWAVPGELEGESGWWQQLVVVNPDGSNPEIVFQNFIADATVDEIMTQQGIAKPGGIIQYAGPYTPKWSPSGDRIAFVGAGQYDPYGPHYKYQIEVWMYELEAGDVTKITDDWGADHELSWKGDNTFPDDPEVTVDNTTVTFEGVSEDGLTTILRDDDPPELPTGYEFCEEFYEVTTTAQIAGPISICMTYDDADIPTGSSEADLCLLHYVEDGDYWEDITVSRDPDNNVVCGETTSLSVFVLSGAPATRFPDVPSHGSGDSGIDPYWAFYEIDACARNGVVGGYGDGSYQPTWQVTRGQMAAFIARALVAPEGDEGLESWTAPVTPTFPDVGTGFWTYKHIEYLKSLKIVGGYDDGLYRPTATVTRSQMAAYMSRAIADPKGDEGLAGFIPPATPTFPDVPVDQWAYTYIEYAAANGVVQGYPYPDPEDPDATIYRYLPGNIVTRSQMAVYVARAFGLPI